MYYKTPPLQWISGSAGALFNPTLPADMSIFLFTESTFLGYPTCLLSAHVVWWSTALWRARTTRRRRPGRSLTWGYITSGWNFLHIRCEELWRWCLISKFFIFSLCPTTWNKCERVVNDTVDAKHNVEKKTREFGRKSLYITSVVFSFSWHNYGMYENSALERELSFQNSEY